MATTQDLQALLRLLTGRKISMMAAMGQVKALQGAGLRSIEEIADAPLSTIEDVLKDSKAAKSLQTACKSHIKKSGKRPATDSPSLSVSASKRSRTGGHLPDEPMTPAVFEASLALPLCLDEALISQTTIYTNRAPLVLAFAVQLLRYTMPEQPLSSRLSLAQAVVSANSRSKAVSLGIEKGPAVLDESWMTGQPRVRVLGREVAVLKRSGYSWRGEEEVQEVPEAQDREGNDQSGAGQVDAQQQMRADTARAGPLPLWVASSKISLKDSTFIAHVAELGSQSDRTSLIDALMNANPSLTTASHNAWAYRIQSPSSELAREDSFDDGETGCGALMLRVMRELRAVNTLIVLTRWFGGTMLGPDRWRLMRECVQGAVAERWRRSGDEVSLDGDALWALDPEGGDGSGPRADSGPWGVVGAQIHRPEAARSYLLRNFASATDSGEAQPQAGSQAEHTASTLKKKTKQQRDREDADKRENLGRLLGALELVYESWADHVTVAELDRKAWSWYVATRPEVEAGPGGWGGKGKVRLADILALRRVV